MLADVGAENITVTTGKLLKPVYGSMCALADTIGVAIGNKDIFEAWLDDLTQGMVDHSITKPCSTDLATFGFVNEKMGIRPRHVGTGKQFPP